MSNRKKNRIQMENSSWKIWVVFIIVLLWLGYYCQYSEREERLLVRKVQMVLQSYQNRAEAGSEWWLTDFANNREKFRPVLEEKRKLIQSLLDRFKNVSSLTERIYRNFGTFSLGVYVDGQIQMPTKKDAGGLSSGICFVPETEVRSEKFISSLFWDSGRNCAMLFAFERPISVLAGHLYHEFGHALRDRVDHAKSAYAEPGTVLFAAEEAEMHNLELVVEDAVMGGVYLKAVKEILGKYKPRNYKEAASNVTLNDLLFLDKALGAINMGKRALGVVAPVHYWAIISCAIEMNGGGESEYTSAYLWMHDLPHKCY
ncbi:MAG: hypothetical protein WCO84_04325 [bacterium]